MLPKYQSLLSKRYYPTLIVLALLVLFSVGLFWYGEETMHAARQGYTVLAFENPSSKDLPCSDKIKPSSLNLDFFIHNQEKETYDYQIVVNLDGEEIARWRETVPTGAREMIKFNKLALPKVSQQIAQEIYANTPCSTKRTLTFKVSWDQGKKQETLSKKINFQ